MDSLVDKAIASPVSTFSVKIIVFSIVRGNKVQGAVRPCILCSNVFCDPNDVGHQPGNIMEGDGAQSLQNIVWFSAGKPEMG